MASRKRAASSPPNTPVAKRQQTLTGFFKPSAEATAPLAPPEVVIAATDELEAAAPVLAPNELTPPNDIGRFVMLERLSDEQRLLMLTDRWRPSCREELPSSTVMKNGKPVKCSLTLDQSKKPWVGVSRHGEQKGVWCVPCVCFHTTDDNC